MNPNKQLSSRLAHASAVLRKGSVKAVSVTDNEKSCGKVQMSWGSAMRR